MKCQNCQQTVNQKSKFCPNCGQRITRRVSTANSSAKSTFPIGYAVGLLGVGILLGFAVFKFSSGSNSLQTAQTIQPAAPVQSAAVLDIAQEFMCPCGKCNDPLDVCNCDHEHGAMEVKGFIAQQLQSGHKKPHIVEMVQEKYGGLKNTAAPLFKFEPPPENSIPRE